MTAPLTIDAVTHRFGTALALDRVNLTIAAGEFVVLLGPSGCGKTTLLSVMGGFLEPAEGRVLIGGRDVTRVAPKERPTTTVFQDYALFPHMTLLDNVAFGLRMKGQGRAERHARAEDMLALVGLAGRGGRRPHELSGGQRQRVALARALAVSPDVLLLDEPLGALDLKLRRQMQDELKAIQRKVGTTFVHVTHDQEEAMASADRIVVMNAGRIMDQGPPREVYLRPKSLFSADFLGEINRVPVTPDLLPSSSPLEGACIVVIRPEAIVIGDGALPLGQARLVDTTFFGTHVRATFASLSQPDLILTVRLPPTATPKPGEVARLAATDYALMGARD
ncbi:MAG: ABC transporter ATP-binding protein [Paracoccaceae bacterium]